MSAVRRWTRRLIEDTARRLAEIRATEQARNAVQDTLKR